MTMAVCLFCGETKFGALTRCEHCGRTPGNLDESTKSMFLSKKCINSKGLAEIRDMLRQGKNPFQTPNLRQLYNKLLPMLKEEAHRHREVQSKSQQQNTATVMPPQVETLGEATLLLFESPPIKFFVIFILFVLPLIISTLVGSPEVGSKDDITLRISACWVGGVWVSFSFIVLSFSLSSKFPILVTRYVLPLLCITFSSWTLCFGGEGALVLNLLGMFLFALNLGAARLSNKRTLIVRYSISLGAIIGLFVAIPTVVVVGYAIDRAYSKVVKVVKGQPQAVIASDSSKSAIPSIVSIVTPVATPVDDIAIFQRCKSILDLEIDAVVAASRETELNAQLDASNRQRTAFIERERARSGRRDVVPSDRERLRELQAQGDVSRQAFQNIQKLQSLKADIERAKALVQYYGDCDAALNAMIHYSQLGQPIPSDQLRAVSAFLLDPRFLQTIRKHDFELSGRFLALTDKYRLTSQQRTSGY